MKIHILTIGKPKLAYAQIGFEEYAKRMARLHELRITHLADRHSNDAAKITSKTHGATVVALEIQGTQHTSEELAAFLRKRELESRELCFVIGGPDGLPQAVRDTADFQWSLSRLTLPHDLAMVATLEALYRASTINAHLPYHK
ncbi:50S rRNA methyltransferase [Candidatus Saccharibacteria bacterium]|nr:MAG: 50S rRNA methyltransferase [Candidatus Saccharibacteria bacterium]PID99535.1 MAG: 50S rRNA methyltransferase [Candidatus Saccharibacteria bacterium]